MQASLSRKANLAVASYCCLGVIQIDEHSVPQSWESLFNSATKTVITFNRVICGVADKLKSLAGCGPVHQELIYSLETRLTSERGNYSDV